MKKKIKQISPARGWAFTLNNYTEDEYSSIVQRFQDVGDKYYFGVGKEIGAQGTPHLQGWCYCMTATKWRPLPRYSVQREGVECTFWTKFTKCMLANHRYCKKGGDYISNYSEEVVETDWEEVSQREVEFNRKISCKWCTTDEKRTNKGMCVCPICPHSGKNMRTPRYKQWVAQLEHETNAEFIIFNWMLKYCY